MKFLTALLVPVLAFGFQGPGKGKKIAKPTPEPTFAKDVKPFLKNYCLKCHSGEKAADRKDYSIFVDETIAKEKIRMLYRGLREVEGKQMPPAKEAKQPKAAEVARFKKWIEKEWEAKKKSETGNGH